MDAQRIIDHHSHVRYPNFFTEDECKHLGYILTRDEHKILEIENNSQSAYKGLTKQHQVYNWLQHPDIRPLNIPKRIFQLPEFKDEEEIRIQCWGNILRHGEDLVTHNHGYDIVDEEKEFGIQHFYAMNTFIDGQEPSYTHYEDIGKTRNIKGEMHIVGCMVEHGVRTNLYTQPRLSIAMDVYTPLGFNQLDLDILNGVSKRRHMEFHRWFTIDLHQHPMEKDESTLDGGWECGVDVDSKGFII